MTQDPKTVVCKYCQRKVRKGERHLCQPMRDRNVAARRADDSDDDFFVSFAVAMATDNWALGYVAGGNVMGAILGDALTGDSWAEAAEPVIAIDPDAGEESADAGSVEEPAYSGSDVDNTAGDSSDSY